MLMIAAPLMGVAQYFQYSQYNFTPLRINPAMASTSDYASATFIFRNQSTGAPDVQMKSSMLSAIYPLISQRTGKRWSGVGVSFMEDRSGGIFSAHEASVSYAINVFLNRFQMLALGFKALYQNRSVDLTGLHTGSQYVADRGFDFSMSNGENIGQLRSDFATFSSGLYWQQADRQGRIVSHIGLAIFDINKPNDNFLAVGNNLRATWVANGGLRLHRERNFSFFSDFLFTHSFTRNVLNVGVTTSYELKPSPNVVAGRVDVITRYVPGRSAILGIQFHRGNLSIGCSYDLPVRKDNAANTGAFEVGVQLQKLVNPEVKKRSARRKSTAKRSPIQSKAPVKKTITRPSGAGDGDGDEAQPKSEDVVAVEKTNALKASLRHKTDSVVAHARAGGLSHEPFLIERHTLQFNFEFNSSELDDRSREYLKDLSEALKENALLKVRLTGHTDNIGSPAFNMRLSLHRANVIRQYLVGQGVEPERIQVEGKGLTEPLNDNKTEEQRSANRRVELLIYYQK